MIRNYSNQSKVNLTYKGTSIQATGRKADLLIYGTTFMLACMGVAVLRKSNIL